MFEKFWPSRVEKFFGRANEPLNPPLLPKTGVKVTKIKGRPPSSKTQIPAKSAGVSCARPPPFGAKLSKSNRYRHLSNPKRIMRRIIAQPRLWQVKVWRLPWPSVAD